jgi:hypothetical protein
MILPTAISARTLAIHADVDLALPVECDEELTPDLGEQYQMAGPQVSQELACA